MRKLIIAVMASLVPFAAWTAGCRQDGVARRSAFPKGPEVRSLARAATAEDVNPTVPMIPAPIEPDARQSPDQPTFARIRSVRDREERFAGHYDNTPGLFVLPDEHNDLAQLMGPIMTPPSDPIPMGNTVYQPTRVIPIANPGGEPLPEPIPLSALAYGTTPAPASPMPEIWSRPMTPMTSAYGFMPPPMDVSAMAPPAVAVPITPTPPAMIPAPAPDPALDMDLMLLPEAIPGIFNGGAEEPTAFIAPKSILNQAGDINPPLFHSSAPRTEDKAPAGIMAPPAGPEKKLAFSEKVMALLLRDDPKQALSPLAALDLKAPGEKEGITALEPPTPFTELATLEPVELAEPPPLSPTLFETAAAETENAGMPADIFIPAPPSDDFPALSAVVETRDLYRMDFWEKGGKPQHPAHDAPFEPLIKWEPEKKTEIIDAVEESFAAETLARMDEPAPASDPKKPERSERPEKFEAPIVVDDGSDAPQKITLVPTKTPELRKIDSSVDAPPLKF